MKYKLQTLTIAQTHVPLKFLYLKHEDLIMKMIKGFITTHMVSTALHSYDATSIPPVVHSAQLLFDPHIMADFMNCLKEKLATMQSHGKRII